MKLIKKTGIGLLKLISGSKNISKISLSFIGTLCKWFPDGTWKSYIISGINQVKWPEIAFRHRRIQIGQVKNILITPHIGEFDFNSMIYNTLPYENELYSFIDKNIQHFNTVIDIGANVGVFSIYMAKAKPTISVFSIEPSRKAFVRLNENVQKNRLENVTIFNAAVTDASGFITFYEPKDHLTNGSIDLSFASLFDPHSRSSVVMCLSGNQLKELITVPGTILLKIDTEGAESIVLNGLKEFIFKFKPHIIIEVLEPYQKSLNELDFIKDLYSLYAITDTGLERRESFFANNEFRDYYLVPSNGNR